MDLRLLNKNDFRLAMLVKLIVPYINDKSIILDYGCGNGYIEEFFAQKAKKIVGGKIKIIAKLSEPFDLNGQPCHVGGSIGISVFPDDAQSLEQLIAQADAAMYLAKQSGKNTYKFHRQVLCAPE